MKPKKDSKLEVRVFTMEEIEYRAGEDGEPGTFEGYAAVFKRWSENLGGFTERIMPGAFSKVLDDDVRALFNHDPNYVLGRTKASTLTLEEDKKGLRMAIKPPNVQWVRDLMESVRRKDINQSSFGFIVDVDGDEWKEDKEGRVKRTIRSFSKLRDVSIVTYPAYTDTKVALRSLDEFRKENDESSSDADAQGDPDDTDAPTPSVESRRRQLDTRSRGLLIESDTHEEVKP